MDYGTPCAKFSQRPPSSYHALNSVNFLHKQNFCSSHNQDSDKSFERTKAFRCKDGIWRRGGGRREKNHSHRVTYSWKGWHIFINNAATDHWRSEDVREYVREGVRGRLREELVFNEARHPNIYSVFQGWIDPVDVIEAQHGNGAQSADLEQNHSVQKPLLSGRGNLSEYLTY